MLTPSEFLRAEIKRGMSPDNPSFVTLARETVEQLHEFKDLSFIDYGAGTGVYANQLQKHGFNVVAQDIWKPHWEYMRDRYPYLDVIEAPVKSDFMLFIEVAEHMTDKEIDEALSIIDPDWVLFSSTHIRARDDQEWGHINVKPQIEWDEFWDGRGYHRDRSFNRPTAWTKLYTRL